MILEALGPYLNHRNQFIRKLAVIALGKAAVGRASTRVLEEIQRVAQNPGPREDEVDMAIATAFAGHPNEEVYALIAESKLPDYGYGGNERAVSVLVRGASDDWYERACREVFEPLLHADDDRGWRKAFVQRSSMSYLCRAAVGRGMEPLNRMLHLRGERCTGHAMVRHAPACFAGAGTEDNRAPLIELARSGDVQAQRIAAVCLGRMAMDSEDGGSTDALRVLCDARHKGVQAAALTGLGMAARSACDEDLRQLCLDRAGEFETAQPAVWALGMVFLGSGRADVFKDIRTAAGNYRARPVRGKGAGDDGVLRVCAGDGVCAGEAQPAEPAVGNRRTAHLRGLPSGGRTWLRPPVIYHLCRPLCVMRKSTPTSGK